MLNSKHAQAVQAADAAPTVWLPLERAVCCLDCLSVFEIQQRCPACAGTAIASLAKWLDRAA